MLGARKGAATVELGSLTMRRKGATPPAAVPVDEGKKAPAVAVGAGGGKVSAEEVWEVRPGGMLVQKRGPEEDQPAPASVKPVPTIRVKAKLAGKTHEIYISAEATFGELRKLVAERAGAHPEDLRALYKGKEQDPKAFLDMAGVRDRSKVAVVDDPEARAAAAPRGAPPGQPPQGRRRRRRRRRRGRQDRAQGGGAGGVGAEGGEGGGERRGDGDGAADERAAEAGRGGRRRRREGAEAGAGEAGAEVRGDARRRDGQERHHRSQARGRGEEAATATATTAGGEAAAAAAVAAPAPPTASAAAAAAAPRRRRRGWRCSTCCPRSRPRPPPPPPPPTAPPRPPPARPRRPPTGSTGCSSSDHHHHHRNPKQRSKRNRGSRAPRIARRGDE